MFINKTTESDDKIESIVSIAIREGLIEDNSYDTISSGWIHSYSGTANVRGYQLIGHRPEGDAWYVSRDGYVEVSK